MGSPSTSTPPGTRPGAAPGIASGASSTLAPEALRSAQIELYFRRTPLNSAATAFNAILLFALLRHSAPIEGLIVWTLFQVGFAALAYRRWRRRAPGHRPRGTRRGIRRAVIGAAISGLSWGLSVLLLGRASDFQRFVVFVVGVSMVSGASTTLASIPNAARGYVLGQMAPFLISFLVEGRTEYTFLAGLSLSLLLFLHRSSTLAHRSFLDEVALSARNAARLERFRADLSEWLTLSQATEAFALFERDDTLLLWNTRFEELFPGQSLQRGVAYAALLRRAIPPARINGAPLDVTAWIAARQALVESGQTLVEETEGPEGFHWRRVSASPGAGGRQVVLIVDITTLKQAEVTIQERDAALARTQRLETVGTLAGGVAHDFNNMLTAIQGIAEWLAREVSTAEAREAVEEIRACVSRGTALTRQLLAHGSRQKLKTRLFDVGDLILKLRPLLTRLLPATIAIEVDIDASAPLAAVNADSTQLEQVILNLVINARDAMPAGGTVRVRARNGAGNCVEIAVEDTGVGIDAATMERIFEPFFTTKKRELGSGLGLAVSHGIVRQSGGSLDVESWPGRGSVFTIRLPAAYEAPEPAEAFDAIAAPRGRGETVLLVDDDESVLKATKATLLRLGYDVLAAGGPDAALRLWHQHQRQVALVLTDVVMPEMTGARLTELLRRDRPDVAVLYMTGYDDGALENLPDAEVVTKPFDEATLAHTLRRATDRRGSPRGP